jgi:hypothetical protein
MSDRFRPVWYEGTGEKTIEIRTQLMETRQ